MKAYEVLKGLQENNKEKVTAFRIKYEKSNGKIKTVRLGTDLHEAINIAKDCWDHMEVMSAEVEFIGENKTMIITLG